MDLWREFHGPNAAYVLELYERYRRDPDSVDPVTREALARLAVPVEESGPPAGGPAPAPAKIAGTVNLAQAIRGYGHLAARLDPLGRPPHGDPSLEPAAHGLSEEDLRRLPASLVGCPSTDVCANAWEAVRALLAIYAGTTGYRFRHIWDANEREWLREAVESGRYRPPGDPVNPPALLERLTQVEVFERFLHRTFPGKTRFSLEGLDMLVPLLDELIGEAAEAGIRSILLGMAHRGRLNVLAHVLNRAVRADPGRVQGSGPRPGPGTPREHDLDGRRQVPPGGPPGPGGRRGGPPGRRHAPQPEPPRVRQPGGGGDGARRGHPGGPPGRSPLRPRGLPAHPDPRRRRLPRPGDRGRDPEPVPPLRLLHRRHHPHHRQQPARLHHASPTTRAAPSTPATWPRASRSPSSTSTPTTRRPASRPPAWPTPTATASTRTS